MTDTVRVPREPLEPVVYGDERDELLALIRKRCPDFTAFPECPPEDMVKGGDTERKNDEAIERAFQDFRLAASPQGEGSSADADTHRDADGAAVAEKVKLILSTYLALINRTPDLLSLLYDADMLPEQTVTVRGAISVAAVCEAYQAGQQAAVSTAERVGMSEANAPYRVTEGVNP